MLDLSNMRIYELRDYARNVGVKSPTTKLKDELIKEINEILEGKAEPKTNNKGRRPKTTYYIDNKSQEIMLEELGKLKQDINNQIDSFCNKFKSAKKSLK